MSVKHLLMAKKGGNNFDVGASGWSFANSSEGPVGGNPLPATVGYHPWDAVLDARKTLNLRAGQISFTGFMDWLFEGGADVQLYIGGILRLNLPFPEYNINRVFTYNLIAADLGIKTVQIVIHAGDEEGALARLVAVSIPIV